MTKTRKKTTSTKNAAKTKAAKIKRVLKLLAQGDSVAAAAERVGVGERTWYTWLADDAQLQQDYARVKAVMAEKYAEEILQIADDNSRDVLMGIYGEVGNRVAVERDRLKVDTRKFLLSKLLPKKYGDKVEFAAEKGAFNLTLRYDREDADA